VSGAAADGTPLLEQARKTAATAARLVSSDPYSAYVLAYDAARFACIALLAQQGLRATTSGGHYAVERSVRAQFGDGFRPFGILRRRRNELEYPHLPADTATSEEAEQAAGTAHGLIAAAGRLLPQLAFFSQNQELGDHRRNCDVETCMLPAFADSLATVRLVLRERAGPSGRHSSIGLLQIRKPGDKPSDNDAGRCQTRGDTLRH
jgi:hypothetical protein